MTIQPEVSLINARRRDRDADINEKIRTLAAQLADRAAAREVNRQNEALNATPAGTVRAALDALTAEPLDGAA